MNMIEKSLMSLIMFMMFIMANLVLAVVAGADGIRIEAWRGG